jgi:hypothetical protein
MDRLIHEIWPSFCAVFGVASEDIQHCEGDGNNMLEICSTDGLRGRQWRVDIGVRGSCRGNMFDSSTLPWRNALKPLTILHNLYNFTGPPKMVFIGCGYNAFTPDNRSWASAQNLFPKFDIRLAFVVPKRGWYINTYPQLAVHLTENQKCAWQNLSAYELAATVAQTDPDTLDITNTNEMKDKPAALLWLAIWKAIFTSSTIPGSLLPMPFPISRFKANSSAV